MLAKPKAAEAAKVALEEKRYDTVQEKLNSIQAILAEKEKQGYKGTMTVGPPGHETTIVFTEKGIRKDSQLAEELFDALKAIGFKVEADKKGQPVALVYDGKRIDMKGDELDSKIAGSINTAFNEMISAASAASALGGKTVLAKAEVPPVEEAPAPKAEEPAAPAPPVVKVEKPVPAPPAVAEKEPEEAPAPTAAPAVIIVWSEDLQNALDPVSTKLKIVTDNYAVQYSMQKTSKVVTNSDLPNLGGIPSAIVLNLSKLSRLHALITKSMVKGEELSKSEKNELKKMQDSLKLQMEKGESEQEYVARINSKLSEAINDVGTVTSASSIKKLKKLMPWMSGASNEEILAEAAGIAYALNLEKLSRLNELVYKSMVQGAELTKAEKKELAGLQKSLKMQKKTGESEEDYVQRVNVEFTAAINAVGTMVLSGTLLETEFHAAVTAGDYATALGVVKNALDTVINIGGTNTLGAWLSDINVPKPLKTLVMTQLYKQVNPLNLKQMLFLKFTVGEEEISNILSSPDLSAGLVATDDVATAADIEQLRIDIIKGNITGKAALDAVIALLEGRGIVLETELVATKSQKIYTMSIDVEGKPGAFELVAGKLRGMSGLSIVEDPPENAGEIGVITVTAGKDVLKKAAAEVKKIPAVYVHKPEESEEVTEAKAGGVIDLIEVAKAADPAYYNLVATSLLSISEAGALGCEGPLLDWSKKLFAILFGPEYTGVTADKKGALVFANAAINQKFQYHVLFQKYIYSHEKYNTDAAWRALLAHESADPSPLFIAASFSERNESVFNYKGKLGTKADELNNGVTVFKGKIDPTDPDIHFWATIPQEFWYTIIPKGENPYLMGEYPAQGIIMPELSEKKLGLSPSFYLKDGALEVSKNLNPVMEEARLEKYGFTIDEKVKKAIASSMPVHEQLYLFDILGKISGKEVSQGVYNITETVIVPPTLVTVEKPVPLNAKLILAETEEAITDTWDIPGDLSYETALALGMDDAAQSEFKDSLTDAYGAQDSENIGGVHDAADAMLDSMPEETDLSGDDATHWGNAMDEFEAASTASDPEEARRHLKNGLDELSNISSLEEGFLESIKHVKKEFIADTATVHFTDYAAGVKGEHTILFKDKPLALTISWGASAVATMMPGTIKTTTVEADPETGDLSVTETKEPGKFVEKGLKLDLAGVLTHAPENYPGNLSVSLYGSGTVGSASILTEEGKELVKTEQFARLDVIGGGLQLKLPAKKNHLIGFGMGGAFLSPVELKYDKTDTHLAPILYGDLTYTYTGGKGAFGILLRSGTFYRFEGDSPGITPFITLHLNKTWTDKVELYGSGTYVFSSSEAAGEKKDILSLSGGLEVKVAGPLWLGGEIGYSTLLNANDNLLSPGFMKSGGLGAGFWLIFKTGGPKAEEKKK